MCPMQRWISAVAALLALAAAGCGSSQTSSSTGASAPPHSAGAPHAASGCSGSQLALSYSGTEGATGHLELRVAVRNVSQTPCQLRGYPGARLLDDAGSPLPLRVTRGHGFFPDTQSRPQPVALKPGASGHFGISFVTNNEYKDARICRTAAAAMLSAPGSRPRWQRVSLRTAPRIAPCGHRLVISPVHA